jgi:hypothetical protein
MKKFEIIFLYSVLAILVFYVFLVDNKVESQGIGLGQYIQAKSIDIVNDEGRAVVMLWANENGGAINIANNKGDLTFLVSIGVDKKGNGAIQIINKDDKPVVSMGANEFGGVMQIDNNKGDKRIALMGATESGGQIGVSNRDGNPVVIMAHNKDDDGRIFVFNKQGDRYYW